MPEDAKPGMFSSLRSQMSPSSAGRFFLHTAFGGAGLGIVVEVLETLKQRPEFLTQLVNGGALYVGFAIVAFVLVDRRLGSWQELQARNVVAQETIAQKIGDMVSKDDARDDAQHAAMRYLASQIDQVLEKQNQLLKGQEAKQ